MYKSLNTNPRSTCICIIKIVQNLATNSKMKNHIIPYQLKLISTFTDHICIHKRFHQIEKTLFPTPGLRIYRHNISSKTALQFFKRWKRHDKNEQSLHLLRSSTQMEYGFIRNPNYLEPTNLKWNKPHQKFKTQ